MNGKSERGYAALRAELKKERDKVKKLSEEITNMLSEENLYELVRQNEEIKNRIISEYLMSLMEKDKLSLIGHSGLSALTPVKRPKNLEDAKRLADKIIKY